MRGIARPRRPLDRRTDKLGDVGGVASAKWCRSRRFEWIFDQRNITNEVFNCQRQIGVQKTTVHNGHVTLMTKCGKLINQRAVSVGMAPVFPQQPSGGIMACLAKSGSVGASPSLGALPPFPSSSTGFSHDSSTGGEFAVNTHIRGVQFIMILHFSCRK